MELSLKIIVIVVICSFVCMAAQVKDNNTQCVNYLVQWCRNMKKPTNFMGNFLTTDYSSSGERQTIHCMGGNGGTNCTVNNTPWFACRTDGSVTYRNNMLQENSPASDDGICDAAKKVRNHFDYDSPEFQAALKAGRQNYERAMSNMRNTLDNVHRSLSRPCFPFCGMSNPFPNEFPFNG